MQRSRLDAPICSPLCSRLHPASSHRIPSRCWPGPPASCHGVLRALGTGGGDGCRGAPRGWQGAPSDPRDAEKEPGAHRQGCAGVAGGPCWVSGPALHSRGLETRPGSGAGGCSQILLLLPCGRGTLRAGAELTDPILRVLHPPVPGMRSPLVLTPAPNAPCAGWGRPGPPPCAAEHHRVPKYPTPPSFQAMLRLQSSPG